MITIWLEYFEDIILANPKYDSSMFLPYRKKRSDKDKEDDIYDDEDENEDSMKKKKDNCEHRVKIDAFGGKYTLCLYLRNFKEEPIVKNSYDELNISIFNNLNVSNDVSMKKFDLYSATGYVIEGNFAFSLFRLI